jgi:N-acetylglucosamine kinase-like BadF-type ATPase
VAIIMHEDLADVTGSGKSTVRSVHTDIEDAKREIKRVVQEACKEADHGSEGCDCTPLEKWHGTHSAWIVDENDEYRERLRIRVHKLEGPLHGGGRIDGAGETQGTV